MAYGIEYDPAAEEHLGQLDAGEQASVLDSVLVQLTHEPTVVTRNRKPMRPNRLAPWVLRIGTLRVYYEVREQPQKLVTVRAVGVKERNERSLLPGQGKMELTPLWL